MDSFEKHNKNPEKNSEDQVALLGNKYPKKGSMINQESSLSSEKVAQVKEKKQKTEYKLYPIRWAI
jgi:hypothetical protein